MTQLKGIRTYQVQVEAILDTTSVQVSPTWFDFPAGIEVTKSSRAPQQDRPADFLQHVGLDWQVLVGEELISYSDYQRRVFLQSKGMGLDSEGEIVAGGMRLKDTMPLAAYELFLKGLEVELTQHEGELSVPETIARPDLAKLEMQARFGARVRRLIQNLFKPRGLIRDGINGCSLVERPVALLDEAIERVKDRGTDPAFKTNSALLHAAVFGFVKAETGVSWSEHQSEQQYLAACRLAEQFLLKLTEQLQWRSWR